MKSYLAHGLIVDDDADIHEIIEAGLPRFKFSHSCGPKDIAKCIDSQTFQFILLDYRLEECTGLALVNQIKTAQPSAVIILMSAYGTKLVLQEAMHCAALF